MSLKLEDFDLLCGRIIEKENGTAHSSAEDCELTVNGCSSADFLQKKKCNGMWFVVNEFLSLVYQKFAAMTMAGATHQMARDYNYRNDHFRVCFSQLLKTDYVFRHGICSVGKCGRMCGNSTSHRDQSFICGQQCK